VRLLPGPPNVLSPADIDWLGLLGLLLLGLALYAVALTALTAWRLTHPRRRGYAWAVSRGVPGDPREAMDAPFEERSSTLDRGPPVALWEVPGGKAGGPVVVLSHGWGSGRVEMLPRAAALRPVASRLILWDMPGHGDSQGACTLGHREQRHLVGLMEEIDEPVVLYGWSLGAELSILAARARPDLALGVIAEGAYRSGWAVALNMLRAYELPVALNLAPALALIGTVFGGRPLRRWFDLAEEARDVTAPLLAVQGADDVFSPPADGEAIAHAAPSGRFIAIEAGDHSRIWHNPQTRQAAERAVRDFVAGLIPANQNPPPQPPPGLPHGQDAGAAGSDDARPLADPPRA